MRKEDSNKRLVERWFTQFWGKTVDLAVVDEIAAPDMLLKYSLHAPRRGHADIKSFITGFRAAFPDLNFWGTAELIAEATSSSASGKAAVRMQVPRSATSSRVRSPQLPVERCTLPARPFSR